MSSTSDSPSNSMTVITVVTSLLHFSACFFKVNSADVRADKCKGESGEVIFAATIAHKEKPQSTTKFCAPYWPATYTLHAALPWRNWPKKSRYQCFYAAGHRTRQLQTPISLSCLIQVFFPFLSLLPVLVAQQCLELKFVAFLSIKLGNAQHYSALLNIAQIAQQFSLFLHHSKVLTLLCVLSQIQHSQHLSAFIALFSTPTTAQHCSEFSLYQQSRNDQSKTIFTI